MTDKQKTLFLSAAVLSAALCGFAIVTVCLLYRTTLRLETQRLEEITHSHAVLIEEFFHAAERFNAVSPQDTLETVLTSVFNAHLHKQCFGNSGEFLIGRSEQGQIIFWPGLERLQGTLPASVPMQSPLAEPMRRALVGQTGSMTGSDYRGVTVLAAYQWVPEMNIGLVAKIDLAEVRKPLVHAAAQACGAALLTVLAGLLVLLRFNPFLGRLEEEKVRAQNYLDIAGTMITVLDENGRIKLINRKGCEILGGEQEGLAGLFWAGHCVQSGDQQAAEQALNLLYSGAQDHVDGKEFRLRRIDDSKRVVEWSGRVLRDKRGKITGVLAAAADITERKQIERTLGEANEAFQATFEQAAVGIGHVAPAPSGRWLRVNRKLCGILGYTAEELLRMNIRDVTHPADLERSLVKAMELVSNPELTTYSMEKQYVRKDGAMIWVNHTVSLVRDEQGKPKYYISVIEDIQARKEMEESLRERTEMLVRSNKELDDFAYIASHDLKEPLRGIMSYSTFLLEDYGAQFGGEVRDKLKTIGDLAERLTNLTDDLLTFSRVGRLELAHRPVSLHQLVDDVLNTLMVSIEREKVKVHIPKPLPTVTCDAVRMREVYYNLISNAVKYNDKADKWIEIGVLHRWNDPGQTVFYVCDNGIGIRDKHTDKVFTMFKRLHGSGKYGGGTGAGLAIVKKIIERHGGHIWLESAEGEGTVFFFTLSEQEEHLLWQDGASYWGGRTMS